VLTADLATVRRRGDELRLVGLDARGRARVEELAAAYQEIARAHLGQPRDQLEAAFREVAVAPAEVRRAQAVMKLVRDGCVFEAALAGDAGELRRTLFRRAAAARRAGGPVDRGAIVDEIARAHGITAAELEAGLFADRAGALRLRAVEADPPASLAAGFELREAQAVLLRAAHITAEVRARDAGTYRRLFAKLKFLRLLPAIAPAEGGGYRLQIDGPFSLFQAVTRYGLQLGLALPAIAECDHWAIDADVRWGAERRPARFRLAGQGPGSGGEPQLPEPVEKLASAIEQLAGGAWLVDRAPAVLDLPGASLCVPDLAFARRSDGARVYLEVLGFWSREAVFRRVDLVRAGLPHRILFAVSRDLRVGEAVLDDVPNASLYVYARTMNAREVLARLDQLLLSSEP
jgi:predicted nuclease of restriction endonuclease-like RecB superfamily